MSIPRKQRRSRRQETTGAKSIGGRTVAGSGAGWVTKNDVKTDDLSLEYKYTDKKSYSLKFTDLLKAEHNALLDSAREFAFVVGFGKMVGQTLRIEREYVTVSREYFEDLRSRGNPQ